MSNRNALAVLGRSGNPAFRGNAFAPDTTFIETAGTRRMTLAGTVNKTGILVFLYLGRYRAGVSQRNREDKIRWNFLARRGRRR